VSDASDASDALSMHARAPWIGDRREAKGRKDATPYPEDAVRATEQDVRRAMFEQSVRIRDNEVDPRRVTRGRPTTSFSSSSAVTTLPMQLTDERASDDPWGSVSYANKEYRGDVARWNPSTGKDEKVAEVWEDLPPAANKDYGASSAHAQHHLVRCTGYDPTMPPPTKKEVPVPFHGSDVNPSQSDFNQRISAAKEAVSHDVFRNGNFSQSSSIVDSSRSNYAGGGYNPVRLDDLHRRSLEKNATWRGVQKVVPVQRSEASALLAQRPVVANRSRAREDAHLAVHAPLVGNAAQVVHISPTAPLPLVAAADRVVAAFRDCATAAEAGGGRQMLAGEVVLVDERSLPLGEPTRHDATYASTARSGGDIVLSNETTAAAPLRVDAEKSGRVFLPIPTHLDDKREDEQPAPRDDHAMQAPAPRLVHQNIERVQQSRSQTAPARPKPMDAGAFLERAIPSNTIISRADDPELARISLGAATEVRDAPAPGNFQTRTSDAALRSRVEAADVNAVTAAQVTVAAATTLTADSAARSRVEQADGAAQGGDFLNAAFATGGVTVARADDPTTRRVTLDTFAVQEERLLEDGVHAVSRSDDMQRDADSMADVAEIGARSAPVATVSASDARRAPHPTAADLVNVSSPAQPCVSAMVADVVRRRDDALVATPDCDPLAFGAGEVHVLRQDSFVAARRVAETQSLRAPVRAAAGVARVADAKRAPPARAGLVEIATRALARFGRVEAKPGARGRLLALPKGYSSSSVTVVSDVDRIPTEEHAIGDPSRASVATGSVSASLPSTFDAVETQRATMPHQPFGHAAEGGREALLTPARGGEIAIRSVGGAREGPLRASRALPLNRLQIERRVAPTTAIGRTDEVISAAPRGRSSPLIDARQATSFERDRTTSSGGRGTPVARVCARVATSEHAHTPRMPSPALRG